MEIGYPLPCDSHVWIHDGYREDVLEVKVRIATGLPADGGDLRLVYLKLKASNNLESKGSINEQVWQHVTDIVHLFFKVMFRTFKCITIVIYSDQNDSL